MLLPCNSSSPCKYGDILHVLKDISREVESLMSFIAASDVLCYKQAILLRLEKCTARYITAVVTQNERLKTATSRHLKLYVAYLRVHVDDSRIFTTTAQ